MQIFVENFHTNKIITLKVGPSDTIKNVREKIPKALFQNEEGISPCDHLLIFARKPLRDCRTIADCKIENGSKLLLVWPLPSSMWINVRIPDDKIIDLQVSTSDTIQTIKAKIQDKVSIPTYQQCLMFAGKILEDGHILQDYNILRINNKDGYRLYLELRLRKKMHVIVRIWNGNSRTFEMEPTDTIESLKAKIQEKEGIQPHDLRLLFHGKVLDETRTLADYNIQNESVLHMPVPNSVIRAVFPP